MKQHAFLKPGCLLLALLPVLCAAWAQPETYDVATYRPPGGWKRETTQNAVSYTAANNATGTWCRISLYASTPSNGSVEQDFSHDWKALVSNTFPTQGEPEVENTQPVNGWAARSGAGRFTFNDAPAAALLTTFTGHGKYVSILALTNSDAYTDDISRMLQSVRLAEPARNTAGPQNAAGPGGSAAASLIGTWVKSGSGSQPKYGDPASWNNAGYTKMQYEFKPDGTYLYYGKSFGYAVSELLLVREKGTYAVSGNRVSVTPQTSVAEAWSKKDGTDKWGRLLSRQNRPLEKTTYQFTKHYFSGIQTWNLVLMTDKPTLRDGPHSQTIAFPNGYLFDIPSGTNLPVDLPPGGQ